MARPILGDPQAVTQSVVLLKCWISVLLGFQAKVAARVSLTACRCPRRVMLTRPDVAVERACLWPRSSRCSEQGLELRAQERGLPRLEVHIPRTSSTLTKAVSGDDCVLFRGGTQ